MSCFQHLHITLFPLLPYTEFLPPPPHFSGGSTERPVSHPLLEPVKILVKFCNHAHSRIGSSLRSISTSGHT